MEAIKVLESSSPPEALRRLREKVEAMKKPYGPRGGMRLPDMFYNFALKDVIALIDAELGKATEEAGR
ncbi:MAG: hypothetical protein KGI38_12725 [Thaumarchaeota archaeon]|nr:hypothetical protein [Nitrososphaerota archaeon]